MYFLACFQHSFFHGALAILTQSSQTSDQVRASQA